MSELRKDLSLAELLERIVQLEGHVSLINEKLADLQGALKLEAENTTEHINSLYDHVESVYQFLADIHDLLWPLVHKEFPGFTESWKQWKTIMKARNHS